MEGVRVFGCFGLLYVDSARAGNYGRGRSPEFCAGLVKAGAYSSLRRVQRKRGFSPSLSQSLAFVTEPSLWDSPQPPDPLPPLQRFSFEDGRLSRLLSESRRISGRR